MKSNNGNNRRAKEGKYRWDFESQPKKPSPEELTIQEVSKVLARMRARHGVTLMQCIGALTCIINHLSSYLLREGFHEAED